MSAEPATPNRLRSLAEGDRPQERMEKHGVGSLSDTELLAMLLRSGTRGHDVLSLAADLLKRAGSLGKLVQWTETDFRQLKGIGKVKAMQLMVVMEVIARVLKEEKMGEAAPMLETAPAVFDYLHPLARGLAVEKFWVLCLNRKNRLLKRVEISSGTASNALAHPREVFREAIREGASAVICVHNHPSGDPTPSNADLAVTRRLREAARAVEIELHDHVILGVPAADPAGLGHYSFRVAGLL
jgi:DNA repair protein RadC